MIYIYIFFWWSESFKCDKYAKNTKIKNRKGAYTWTKRVKMDKDIYKYTFTHLKCSFTQKYISLLLQTAFYIDCKAEGASQKVKLDHIHLISEDFNPRWAQMNHQEAQADQGFIQCLQRRNQLDFFWVCVHPAESYGEKSAWDYVKGTQKKIPALPDKWKITQSKRVVCYVVWENLRWVFTDPIQ